MSFVQFLLLAKAAAKVPKAKPKGRMGIGARLLTAAATRIAHAVGPRRHRWAARCWPRRSTSTGKTSARVDHCGLPCANSAHGPANAQTSDALHRAA
jgi:hypothetical protein